MKIVTELEEEIRGTTYLTETLHVILIGHSERQRRIFGFSFEILHSASLHSE